MKPARDCWKLCWLAGSVWIAGCAGTDIRSQSPEDALLAGAAVRLVGDLSVPYGMSWQKVEGNALVTGLSGTGDDPAPSPQFANVLHDMQARGVKDPQTLLSSPGTAMVMVRGYMKPGILAGDHFDLEVRVASNSETSSLRGGWMMETRLKELAVMDNRVYDGHLLALGEGAILTDTRGGQNDRISLCRGRVLGGGTALKSRPLGLVLKPDDQSLRKSAQLGLAVNRRFHLDVGGRKEPVAKPIDEQFIELKVHPRYKDNVPRYMQVVRAIAVRESAAQRASRMELLQRQLSDPITAASAALQLEAVGKEGRKVLLKGIDSVDPEVRFYSAEALAYLDDSAAAEPLMKAARDEPAFRVFALTAMSSMDDFKAYDQLASLLDVDSAETRYGAFRALWAMNPQDSLVRGELLNSQFSYHVIESGGPAMIHVTRSFRPEVVVFGAGQRIHTPCLLDAGPQILVKGEADGTISVSRFAIGRADQKRSVDNRVDDVVRAVTELEGTYPDVVQLLQEASAKGLLSGRFEIDALPKAGRLYERDGGDQDDFEESRVEAISVSNPVPNLFPKSRSLSGRRRPSKANSANSSEDEPLQTADATAHPRRRKAVSWRSFLDRIIQNGR